MPEEREIEPTLAKADVAGSASAIPLPPQHLLKWPNGMEMAFRLIPAGSFRMGSRGEYADEEPIHTVEIPEPFWLGETPVTQAQFAIWTAAAKIEHENHFANHSDSPNHPAERINWFEADAYCEWLSRTMAEQLPEDGKLACLPTEAEWEYACRAGTETKYHNGDGEAALAEVGWFGEELVTGSTHRVGEKSPNDFGLFDMHGNVWEWCHDVFDESAYRQRPDGAVDPGWKARQHEWSVGLDKMTNRDISRVLRGGSWGDSARDCRSASRYRIGPGDRVRLLGFRVCLVRGPASPGRGAPAEREPEAKTGPGDGSRGTRRESAGPVVEGEELPDLAEARLPRAAGRNKS